VELDSQTWKSGQGMRQGTGSRKGALRAPRDVIQPRWGVYALRKKAERYGSVEARSEKEAIEAALKQYEIAERDRWRISVRREA